MKKSNQNNKKLVENLDLNDQAVLEYLKKGKPTYYPIYVNSRNPQIGAYIKKLYTKRNTNKNCKSYKTKRSCRNHMYNFIHPCNYDKYKKKNFCHKDKPFKNFSQNKVKYNKLLKDYKDYNKRKINNKINLKKKQQKNLRSSSSPKDLNQHIPKRVSYKHEKIPINISSQYQHQSHSQTHTHSKPRQVINISSQLQQQSQSQTRMNPKLPQVINISSQLQQRSQSQTRMNPKLPQVINISSQYQSKHDSKHKLKHKSHATEKRQKNYPNPIIIDDDQIIIDDNQIIQKKEDKMQNINEKFQNLLQRINKTKYTNHHKTFTFDVISIINTFKKQSINNNNNNNNNIISNYFRNGNNTCYLDVNLNILFGMHINNVQKYMFLEQLIKMKTVIHDDRFKLFLMTNASFFEFLIDRCCQDFHDFIQILKQVQTKNQQNLINQFISSLYTKFNQKTTKLNHSSNFLFEFNRLCNALGFTQDFQFETTGLHLSSVIEGVSTDYYLFIRKFPLILKVYSFIYSIISGHIKQKAKDLQPLYILYHQKNCKEINSFNAFGYSYNSLKFLLSCFPKNTNYKIEDEYITIDKKSNSFSMTKIIKQIHDQKFPRLFILRDPINSLIPKFIQNKTLFNFIHFYIQPNTNYYYELVGLVCYKLDHFTAYVKYKAKTWCYIDGLQGHINEKQQNLSEQNVLNLIYREYELVRPKESKQFTIPIFYYIRQDH